MVILLNPNVLAKYLWKTGPYIYFFNGACGGANAEIVKYINHLSDLHPKLKIFQIDWKEQQRYCRKFFQELNKVFLYFEGEKKFEVFNPTKKEIEFLFLKCTEYYNENLKNKIKNIGAKIQNKTLGKHDSDHPESIKTQKETQLQQKYVRKKLRELINRKIQSPMYISEEERGNLRKHILMNKSLNSGLRKIAPKMFMTNLLNNKTISPKTHIESSNIKNFIINAPNPKLTKNDILSIQNVTVKNKTPIILKTINNETTLCISEIGKNCNFVSNSNLILDDKVLQFPITKHSKEIRIILPGNNQKMNTENIKIEKNENFKENSTISENINLKSDILKNKYFYIEDHLKYCKSYHFKPNISERVNKQKIEDFKNQNPEKDKEFDFSLNPPREWFRDVQISDLPLNILDKNLEKEISKELENQNESYGRNSTFSKDKY